jgi:hypothetical protein
MPIVCVDEPGGGYYADLLGIIKSRLLRHGLISPDDLSLFTVTTSVRKAFAEVMKFYHVYNSQRYVRDELYLRLHHTVDDALLDRLNTEFKDLLVKGTIRRAEAHPFEADDEHLAELPRLALHFNRRDYGRLRQLINVINEELEGPGDKGQEEEE